MKNKSYIGLSFIILIFGIIFIPKIINRIKNGTVVQGDRIDAVSNHKNPETGLMKICPFGFCTKMQRKTIVNRGKVSGLIGSYLEYSF